MFNRSLFLRGLCSLVIEQLKKLGHPRIAQHLNETRSRRELFEGLMTLGVAIGFRHFDRLLAEGLKVLRYATRREFLLNAAGVGFYDPDIAPELLDRAIEHAQTRVELEALFPVLRFASDLDRFRASNLAVIRLPDSLTKPQALFLDVVQGPQHRIEICRHAVTHAAAAATNDFLLRHLVRELTAPEWVKRTSEYDGTLTQTTVALQSKLQGTLPPIFRPTDVAAALRYRPALALADLGVIIARAGDSQLLNMIHQHAADNRSFRANHRQGLFRYFSIDETSRKSVLDWFKTELEHLRDRRFRAVPQYAAALSLTLYDLVQERRTWFSKPIGRAAAEEVREFVARLNPERADKILGRPQRGYISTFIHSPRSGRR